MKTPQLHYYDMGPGVTAFSTTRHGGYGTGAYGEFNINNYCGDDETAIGRNRQALCRLLGIDDAAIVMPHQTHETRVATVDEALLRLTAGERRAALEGIDAVMTSVPGVCVGVSTADCIPLLLYDPVHRAVCAVHAGWRGTVRRIAGEAVAAMASVYATQPSQLVAQIGPGISLDSFEVGQEVFEVFSAAGFDMQAISRRYPSHADPLAERWHIDLPHCNRLQLVEAGMRPEAIGHSPACTFVQHDTFFSARRLGIRSGRVFNAIMLE